MGFMMKHLLGLVLLAVAVAASNKWNVTHLYTAYDQDNMNTVFAYRVDILGGTTTSDDVSELVISPPSCAAGDLAAGQAWTYSSNQGGAPGFLYECGQDAQTTQTAVYYLRMSGKVGTTAITATLRGNSNTEVENTNGPDCQSSPNYPDVTSVRHPNMESPPAQCSAYSATTFPTYDANHVLNHQQVTEGRCADNQDLTREYLYTSGGLTTVYTQRIKIVDTQAPEFMAGQIPSDATVKCQDASSLPPPPTANASDLCDPRVFEEGEITCGVMRTNGTCPHSYFLTHTWTATDRCGNSKCETQTIFVYDDEAPQLDGVEPSKTLDCEDPNLSDLVAVPSVSLSDNCDSSQVGSVTPVIVTEDGECENTYVETRRWSATDACGNTITKSQVIRVEDTKPPVFDDIDNSPDNVQCQPNTPLNVTARDNCSTLAVTPVRTEQTTGYTCAHRYVLTRIWTATDGCGNSDTLSHVTVVNDTTLPTIPTFNLGDTSKECGTVQPQPDFPGNDNCDGDLGNAVKNESRINSIPNCPFEYTLNRTWTVTDVCGNTNVYGHTITVEDTTPPVFDESQLPPNNTVYDCNSPLPNCETIKPPASDTCNDTTVTVSVTTLQTNTSQVCLNNYTIVCEWTATDCADNSEVLTYHYRVEDMATPVMNTVAPSVDDECYDRAPAMVSATDTCGTASVSRTSTNTSTGACASNYTVQWDWTATDECELFSTQQQIRTVSDNNPPLIHNVPPGTTVECHAVPPIDTGVNTTDVCDEHHGYATELTVTEVRANGTCPNQYTLTRTWEATDECNHVTTKTQTIEVVDTIAPVLDPEPTAETVSCESVPQPADVCASDNCTGVELQFNQTRVPGTCTHSYTLQRTWTAYDACLNQKQHTQLVTVQDLTDPHWTSSPLPNRSHELCTDPNRNATGTVTAEDNCDDDVEITIKTSFGPRDCQLEYTVTHIYEAKDDCNNDIVHNETYPVIKTQPPTINTQGLLTPNLECECDDLDSCLSEWPTVQDVCGSDENNGLRFCFPPNNNRNDCTDPTLYKEELLGDYGSDDNCNATNRMRRTWWAIDACGNNASVTQTVIIKDTTPPVFDVNTLPADVNTTCSLPPIVDPNATDTCGDVTVDLTINTPTSMGSCRHEYTVTREWTARDCAGNKVAYNQTIYVQDKTPPYFTSSPQAEVTAECQDVPLPPGLCAKDTCQGVNMTFAEVRSGGSCIHNYNLSRTWVAMDECGNTATETQVVIVEDHEDPKWDAGSLPIQDASDECTMTPITDPWGTDNCGTPTVSYTEFNDTGVCANDFTYTRNYTLTDACDRKATYNVRRVVKDTVDPYFTKFPTNESEQRCTFFTTVPDVQGTDDCNTATVSGPVVTWDNTTCIYEYTKHSKYTLEDECQNSVEKVWSQTVTYNNVPYWMNQPSDRLNLEACGTDESASPSDPNAFDGCHNSIDDNITRSETPTNLTSCPPDRQVVYEWQVTDPCDNSLSFQRTYKWTDNTPPSWNNPGNLPQNEVDLEYSDSPVNCQRKNPGDLTANDACAGMITATPVKNTTDGDCPYRFRDDWKWTATDDCEHSITHSIYISYKHTLGPILNLDETDQNDECDDVQPPRPATATDRCGENITASIVRTSTVDQSCAASGDTAICAGCTNNYDIVHVYSVTDKCNLTTTKQYITRVRDTTMPRLVGVPADVTVECGFEPPVAEVTVADNCPGVRIIYNETIEGDDPDNCCNYTILRRWTAIDACGKSVSKLQKVKVEDTFPPRIDACPDETSECPTVPECNNVTAVEVTAQAWCVEDPTTTDGCSGTGSDTWSVRYNGIDYHSSNLVLVRQANGSAHITGSASDSSNTNTITLHINLRRKVATVNKSTAISNAIASDLLGSCYNAGQPADRNGWRFYYDPQGYITINGGSQLAVTSTDNAQAGLGANGRNAHMGFAYDFTANSQTGQVRLQLDTNPSSSCQLPLLQFPELVCEPISFTNDTHNDVQNCVNGDKVREVITRTWYATDVNGNTAKAVQVVTIVDNTKPTLEYNATEFMEQSSVSCELWPLPWPTVNATDDCETGIVVTTDTWFNESSLGCPNDGKHTRLFEASDECGNKASVSYTITVYDRKGPVIQSPPDNATHECHDIANYQNPPSLTSSDNCDDTNSVTNTRNERINGTCDGNFRIERDYEAYDDCGNPSVYNYTLFFVDTGKPQLINTPPDTSAECSIPASIAPTGVDNCTDDVSVSLKEENTTQGLDCKVNGGHYFSLLRTWTATDSCQNQESYTQTIDVYDTTPPTFTATPLNSGTLVEQTTEECSDIPPAYNVTADDSCRGVTVGPVDESETPMNQRRCRNEYTITRKWVAKDECDNEQTFTHNIDVVDTTPPTLTGTEANTSASCESIPMPADVCAEDNCNGVTLDYDQTIINVLCTHNYTIRREWNATDACGRSTVHVQTILVTDSEAPKFDQNPLPQGKTVQCHEILAGQHSMQTLTATDNCVNNTVEDTEVPTNNGCNGNYTLTRDWAVWDDCGHNTTWRQVVTVIDTVKPVLNGSEPQDVTVDCQGPRPAGAPPIEQLSATDSCSTNAIDITVVQATNDNIVNGSCPGSYVIKREWTFTDDCNNQLVVNQDVTVRDVTPPHWTFFPDDTTIECDDPIPRVDPTAADNCTTQIMPYVNETSIGGGCLNESRLERKWTACDECNNCITKTQTIYIKDTEPPVLSSKPGNAAYTCESVPPAAPLTATDNCATVDVSFDNGTEIGSCTHNYTKVYMWNVTDNCGNVDGHIQRVTVYDTTNPQWDPNTPDPQDTTIECTQWATYTPPEQNATDNCADVQVSRTNRPTDLGCANNFSMTYEWTVKDDCDNEIFRDLVVTVLDRTPPTLNFTNATDGSPYIIQDQTVDCHPGEPAPPVVTASDACSNNATVVTENPFTPGCTGTGVREYTWTNTDHCGHTVSRQMTITVIDETPPEWVNFPPDASTTCDSPIPPDTTGITASDLCSSATISHVKDTRINGTCPHRYTIIRTYRATDECNNFVDRNQTITVTDDLAPQFIGGTPPPSTHECSNIEVPPPMCAKDTCGVVDMTFTEHKLNGTCAHNYTLNRTWVVVDECMNTNTEFQVATIEDTTPPTFKIGSMDLNPTATCHDFNIDAPAVAVNYPDFEDLCSDTTQILVSLDSVTNKTSQECTQTFDIERKFIATDDCGNEGSIIQTLHIIDNIDPIPGSTRVECLNVVGSASAAQYEVISTVSTGTHNAITLFTATDSCDPEIKYVPTSCSSDQDSKFTDIIYGNDDPNDDVEPGFNSDCYYVAAEDKLYIRRRLVHNESQGRLFTFTALATDDCNNTATVTKQWLAPLTDDSWDERGITDPGGCSVGKFDGCGAACPCEYNDPVCEAGSQSWSLSMTSHSYDATQDETSFSYTLSNPSNEALYRVIIGVDLTKAEVVSATPTNVGFGFRVDSYISGLVWNYESSPLTASSATFSFTLKGNWDQTKNIGFQLLDNSASVDANVSSGIIPNTEPNKCITSFVQGPYVRNVTSSCSGVTLNGHVGVFGLLPDNLTAGTLAGYTTSQFGMPDAVIVLQRKNLSTWTRHTVSNDNGDFTFTCLDPGFEYTLRVEGDGALHDKEKLQEYVWPPYMEANYPFGGPSDATSFPGGTEQLRLFLSSYQICDRTHSYFRRRISPTNRTVLDLSTFVGISHTPAWWSLQYTPQSAIWQQAEFTPDELTTIMDQANTFLAKCTTPVLNLLSGTTIQSKLAASTLDYISGGGILAEFRPVGRAVLRYAEEVVCGGGGSGSNDATETEKMLDKLQEAF